MPNSASLGAEEQSDLLLTVDAEISWSERLSEQDTKHPGFERIAPVLAGLEGARKERATQYFYWCLVNSVELDDPAKAEDQLHRCTLAFGKEFAG